MNITNKIKQVIDNNKNKTENKNKQINKNWAPQAMQPCKSYKSR